MSKSIKGLILFVYVIFWRIDAGAIFQDFQHEYSDCTFEAQLRRHDLAFACFWALVPPAILLTPILTGFYEHGISFASPKCPGANQ